MSESEHTQPEYTQRELADFRLKNGRELKPFLTRQLHTMFLLLLPDAESRLEMYRLMFEYWAHNRASMQARKEARDAARKRPRVRLVASNGHIVSTEPAMPRDAFRVIAGRPNVVDVETAPETSHEPEAA